MKQKVLLIFIVMLFLVQWTCTTGEKPPFSKNLWVPFYWQEQSNWCGPACVQMWADKCGIHVEQLEIAAFCGNHAVIITGFDWEEDPFDGKPVAIGCIFHDPNGLAYDYISAKRLNQYFDTGGSNFWVILAYSWLEWQGIEGFNDFIAAGGIYYGGPDVYNPSDLDPQQ